MKLRFVAVISAILLLFGLINWYIGWNGWAYLSALFGWERPLVYGVVIAILALSYILGRLGQNYFIRPLARPIKLIGSYWFAIVEYGILLLPPADLALWLLTKASVSQEDAVIAVGTIVAVILAAILIRGSWNAWTPIVRSYEVSLAKSAGSIKGLTIGVASDIHLGTTVGNRHLQRLVDEMERMKPDLILLPGDVLDDDIDPFIRYNMAQVMKKLQAPLGVYAVLGNHEYIGGHIERFVAEMDAIGIRVLLDENVLIKDSFYIIGRKDAAVSRLDKNGRKAISQLVSEVDHSLPIFMMDHQPSDLSQAAANGIDLSLSGHTHRGQMAPNHLITRKLFELDWGYMKKANLHAIVSSGFGSWGPPIRIGSRSEIVRVDVRFETVNLNS
ncbi:metallophosphoesterase [Paenibacillus sp. NEAU-GSW1]|uniref:metallophosphoesterase n=1 Tax=Paenibacillus sp. NEAU-GSW1 TaxID=2682486 RepID=UPI0012E25ED2|nr:metallophosphoesterase [Paenibacillus sp. NEAU-GSW1]MUT64314.1 metallophosphoesterase [Paenibacillus sp. NEAU-GSW1]